MSVLAESIDHAAQSFTGRLLAQRATTGVKKAGKVHPWGFFFDENPRTSARAEPEADRAFS